MKNLFVYKNTMTSKYLKINTNGVANIKDADKFRGSIFIINANKTYERINYFEEIQKIRKEKLIKLNEN